MWHRLQNICIWMDLKKNQKGCIWSNLIHQILSVHSMQGSLPNTEESSQILKDRM